MREQLEHRLLEALRKRRTVGGESRPRSSFRMFRPRRVVLKMVHSHGLGQVRVHKQGGAEGAVAGG
jgi:hypothetical protein